MVRDRAVRGVLCVLALTLVTACGGGGGGGASSTVPVTTPTTTPTTSPASPSSSATAQISASSASSVTLPAIANGVAATITFPASAASGASAAVVLSATPPAGVTAVSAAARRPRSIGGTLTPLAYVTVTPSAAVSFYELPAVAVTAPSGASGYGYLAYDNPTSGWVAAEGAAPLLNGSYVLSPTDIGAIDAATEKPNGNPMVFGANQPYVFAIFTSSSLESITPPGNDDANQTGCTSSSVAHGTAGARRMTAAGTAALVPNRLYVTVRDPASLAAAATRVGAIRIVPLGATRAGLAHAAITLPKGADAGAALATLRGVSGITEVARLHYRALAADAEANDPDLSQLNQWYLYKTATDPTAWNVVKATSATKIAVIDTGIDETNTDLASAALKMVGIVGGVTFASAQDTNGHGSNTSGLAAAATNNGYGFAGESYGAGLLSYKIFPDAVAAADCQGADTADEAAAIDDAVASGAAVISLSLGSANGGGSGADTAEQTAIEDAIGAGVVVVAANGNEGPGNAPDYPGDYANVINVGASATNDGQNGSCKPTASNDCGYTYGSITETVASYSNDGPMLLAPGGDPQDPTGDQTYQDNDPLHWVLGYDTTTAGYSNDRCSDSGGVCAAYFAGTSQATPQVAGAVALLLAKHGGKGSVPVATVISDLKASTDQIPNATATRQGAGRLNAGTLVTSF